MQLTINRAIAIICGIVLTASLSACSGGLFSSPTATPTFTAIPPSPTPLPPTETATPLPTATPTETASPTSTEIPLPSATPTDTPPPPTPSGDDAIYIYYIKLGGGGGVGCGDSLVALNTGIWRTGDVTRDVRVALERLFSYHSETWGTLYNPLWRSSIGVADIGFHEGSGELTVYLSGVYGRSGDRCDSQRARAMIWATMRQFPQVKGHINAFLNSSLLGDILAGK